jgi:hypothetical protein
LGRDGDDAPGAYRLSIDGSDEALRVSFQGSVVLKPLGAPATLLDLQNPDSLVLYPRSRSLDLDVVFSHFAGDEIARDVRIDRLALLRVVEQHGAEQSMVREESTLLGGEVLVRATGKRRRLEKGESLRFSHLAGSLIGLRLGLDGIRFVFQGRVSELERAAQGLQPENLMPSALDLWIAGSTQRIVLTASGVLALIVLLLTVMNVRLREKETP